MEIYHNFEENLGKIEKIELETSRILEKIWSYFEIIIKPIILICCKN